MQIPKMNQRRFSATLLRVIGLSAILAFTGMAFADPPMRVARMGYLNGPVSFSPAGENDWVAGTLNRPLVTGDRLWADGGARAELQIGSAVVRLGSRTFFTLTNLDDRIAQMDLQDGTLNLRVRRLDRGQVVEIDTPNLALVIRQPGEYRVTVDAAQDSTEVRTRSGRADVFGAGANYAIASGAAYRFFGGNLDDYDVLALSRPDEFDRWSQARDRSYDTSISARYVSRDVIGYQDLDQYGSWRNVPDYGNVWTPSRVAADWAPYRDGHWSWVEPWGWTWIDDQPWGFTVSHYGRWANAGGRWSWIPGPVSARAVYAPALVAFIGGSNFQVSASSGNVGAVGWFPLGPREVYRPAYTVSRDYFTNVNISNTVINNTTIINNYDNRNSSTVSNMVYANRAVQGAVVTVPTATFVQSQPVARAAIRVSEAAIVNAPVNTLAAVAPVRTSVLGAAPPRAMPPQPAQQRTIAQTQPPAAVVGFAVRERALSANPGKPVDTAALAAMKPAAPPAGSAPVTPGMPAVPGTAPPAPRVQIVPAAPAAAAAPVAPPPRAPSDRRGSPDQLRPPRGMPPSTQPQTAPLPAPPQQGVRPPSAVPQDAPRPGNKPAEAPGRPVVATPPAQVTPPAAPMGSTAPGRGDKPREQREPPLVTPPAVTVPSAPVRTAPPARAPQQQPAPPVVAPIETAPVVAQPPQRIRPQPPEAAQPKPPVNLPQPPAPAAHPPEPAKPTHVPAEAGRGERKTPIVEEKRDDKRNDKKDEKSDRDEEEKKRK